MCGTGTIALCGTSSGTTGSADNTVKAVLIGGDGGNGGDRAFARSQNGGDAKSKTRAGSHSTVNQGKVTGALGCINWLAMSLLHEGVGDSIRRTGNYAEGLALAGLAPLVGFAILMLLWAHVGVVMAFGVARGFSLGHCLFVASQVAVFAAFATK